MSIGGASKCRFRIAATPKETCYPSLMNCRIPEIGLRGVCRELLRRQGPVTHRALRQALRDRFGAAGKTARVLKIWHEEADRWAAPQRTVESPPANALLPTDVVVLQEQLAQAQREAALFKARAEVAEVREQAHQDRWFLEIDRLREQLRAQPNYQREIRTMQDTIMRLTAELAVLRSALRDGLEGQGDRS
jgi:cysteinyl-tRNA synthetase